MLWGYQSVQNLYSYSKWNPRYCWNWQIQDIHNKSSMKFFLFEETTFETGSRQSGKNCPVFIFQTLHLLNTKNEIFCLSLFVWCSFLRDCKAEKGLLFLRGDFSLLLVHWKHTSFRFGLDKTISLVARFNAFSSLRKMSWNEKLYSLGLTKKILSDAKIFQQWKETKFFYFHIKC